MGIGAGIKWVGREGAGIGAAKRFGWIILRNSWNPSSSPHEDSGTVLAARKRFLNSAASVVMAYGPSWARRSIYGRAIGVWMLAALWVLPPSIMIVFTLCKPYMRSGPTTRGSGVVADPVRQQACPGHSE